MHPNLQCLLGLLPEFGCYLYAICLESMISVSLSRVRAAHMQEHTEMLLKQHDEALVMEFLGRRGSSWQLQTCASQC